MSTHTFSGLASPANPSAMKVSKHFMIGVILLVALVAFEIFNFDTTRFALDNLLGGSSFVGLKWATVLAIAFCAIDFAGLARIFTPEQGLDEEPKEVWYLMGAWLLGATMNAIMTWWAVSLTLLESEFGNEVLNRQQLLTYVPVFVAFLVWLTRIMFIGALSVAGDQLLNKHRQNSAETQHVNSRRYAVAHPQLATLKPTAAPQFRPNHAPAMAAQQTVMEPDEAYEPQPRKLARQPAKKAGTAKPRTQTRRIQRPVRPTRPQPMAASGQHD